MARTNATKSTVEDVVTETASDTVEKMNEERNTIEAKPLNKSDEIKVVSLVSNVSYKDRTTGDMYEWSNAGDSEYLTVETLDNMWRSNKGYFNNLWLKPKDDRVIKRFGLDKKLEKYEYLMNGSNYTKKNIGKICDAIANTPIGLKFSICDKIKSLVVDGEISDVIVIRELEKRLKIDLIEFLD